MLTKITLENFKVFRHATEFPLAKINLLTGINGRGKSSLLQSLLLMRQSIEHNENTTELILNGNCVHLGTWEDVKNKDEEANKEIKFTFESTDAIGSISISYTFSPHFFNKWEVNTKNHKLNTAKLINGTDNYVSFNPSIMNTKELVAYGGKWKNFMNKKVNINYPDIKELSNFINFLKIHYIAADRIGARDFYEKDLNLNNNFITIEKTGKNVLDNISRYKKGDVYESLYLGDENKIPIQIGKWLGHILDATVAIDLDDKQKFVNSFTYTINGKKDLLPSNVGFGYSYILPIITAGLIAKKGEILIVENPEAHLHPKAQSRLTEFLAKVAATGVQVFVESHSEHILNGLRIATLKKDIDLTNDDVSVLYFQDVENQPFIRLNIEKDGSIKNWVEGFFDQQEIDLSEIFKLNRAKK